MKRILGTIFSLSSKSLILISALAIAQKASAEKGFQPLFNGKDLNGWVSARNIKSGEFGDFSVNKELGAIQVYSGIEDGALEETDVLFTDKSYSHYVLKFKYKWGDKKFEPRTKVARDSGVLFHITNNLSKVWPDCIEYQMGDSDPNFTGKARYRTGDLFVIGWPITADVRRGDPFFDPEAPLQTQGVEKRFGRCWTNLGKENPHGEWNDVEIRVNGAELAEYFLNGEKVLEVEDMKMTKKGETIPLESGRIGFQAEWAEVFFKDIYIKDLSE
ncbi:MAG: 3-keto-disaccharide hydrolase [Opitutales bacterium]